MPAGTRGASWAKRKSEKSLTNVLTYCGTVYPWQCDQMGHMNVMWYVSKFDEATWQLLARIGITPSYLRSGKGGIAGVQQNISYKRELFPGSVIQVHSHLVSIRERSIVFVHEMRDMERDEIAAVCELTAVHMNLRERKAIPFPVEVVAMAREMLERT
jgi:acyl-CoA thioester hydrolase